MSNFKNIPAKVQTVRITDPANMPAICSETPGGTIFSTTPGGTRIIYDRAFLMECRNSPLTKTPPKNLPYIEGITSPRKSEDGLNHIESNKENNRDDGDQFQMDI